MRLLSARSGSDNGAERCLCRRESSAAQTGATIDSLVANRRAAAPARPRTAVANVGTDHVAASDDFDARRARTASSPTLGQSGSLPSGRRDDRGSSDPVVSSAATPPFEQERNSEPPRHEGFATRAPRRRSSRLTPARDDSDQDFGEDSGEPDRQRRPRLVAHSRARSCQSARLRTYPDGSTPSICSSTSSH